MENQVIKQTIISVVLLMVIGGGFGGYYWWRVGTPRYSMQQLEDALKSRDINSALRYFDADAFVDNFFDRVAAETIQSTLEKYPTAIATVNIQTMVENMKLSTGAETKKKFLDMLENYVPGKPTTKLTQIIELGFAAQNITQIGNSAWIKVGERNKIVLARSSDRRWRIVEIEGLFDAGDTNGADTRSASSSSASVETKKESRKSKESVKPAQQIISVEPSQASSVYCTHADDCDGFKIKIDFDEDIESCAAAFSCNYSNKILQTKQIYYVVVRGDTVGGEVRLKNLNSGIETDYEDITAGNYKPATGEISFWYGYYLYPNIKMDFVSINHDGKIQGEIFTGYYRYSTSEKDSTRGTVTYLPVSISDRIPKKGCNIKGDIGYVSGGQKTYYMPFSATYSQLVRADEWFCSEAEAANAGYKKALQ